MLYAKQNLINLQVRKSNVFQSYSLPNGKIIQMHL